MLSIGDIAARVGLRTSALRYYERLGLLPPPPRKGGRRQYDERVLDRLAVIRFARETGFTIREIQRLLGGKPYSDRLRGLAKAKVRQLDLVLSRARMMQSILRVALRCNCLDLEDCGRRLRQANARGSLHLGR
jgi:MerR family redox-sensitive transcriptional activator SoxR